MNDNLPELRDIHLPDGVSAFPPAYGWYIIIFSLVCVIIAIYFYHIWRIHSQKLYAQKIIKNLDYNNIIQSAVQISELLRRICIYRYPEAVSLSGNEWLQFLSSHNKRKISSSGAQLLLNAPYINPQNHPYTVTDLKNLATYTLSWIGENL